MKKLVLILLLSYTLSYFTNPVIYADSPDPGILFYNNYYYVVGTNSNYLGLFVIRRSSDLVNWQEIGVVFTNDDRPRWADNSVI